ncbi:putative RNA-binding protein (virulence factor B family) [Clostridium moniliforme]|uniref:RNA-binding protein (Virulence factor B family) n=1 Tax=Clostridium moniliforme TaxID=39489 RepID=A0ABS4EXV8_9CLOT|nr:S1-like domain-containing RNA-binding protein [Clostridium moniliforme]MBP1888839.1 putative RNA-binding protein (virulence factor B family) [Clostridium moniliforme]
MIKIGEYNKLEVVKERDFGFFLSDNKNNEILLPKSLLNGNTLEVGDEVEIFAYMDSQDRPIATMKKPLIEVGKVAYLEVVDENKFGAFCNMGLEKDLFVPLKEQRFKLLVGKKYLFYAYLDKTGRLAATTDVDDYLDQGEGYKVDDIVNVISYGKGTSTTIKVAIDGKYRGIILGNEHIETIYPGDELKARVKRIYEDGTVGLSTRKKRLDARSEIQEKILKYLRENDGVMAYNDRSNPEEIREVFGTSKNYFKMALGGLMKEGLIEQSEEGTKLK